MEALRVARGWGSHIFRHSAHRWWQGCQPYAPAAFYPQEDTWYSFLSEAESTPGPFGYPYYNMYMFYSVHNKPLSSQYVLFIYSTKVKYPSIKRVLEITDILHVIVHSKICLRIKLSPFHIMIFCWHPCFCNVWYMFIVNAKMYNYFMNLLFLCVCVILLHNYVPPSSICTH
jgi:hypothetical protein